MRNYVMSAIAAAVLTASGCSAYHPSALAPEPYGPTALHDRIVADPNLQSRFPIGADVAEANYPEGALAPQPRPANAAWGIRTKPGWFMSRLDREAERRTIERDAPYATVSPAGTVHR